MSIPTYGLGGTEVKLDASEAMQEIPQNRTLLVEQLTNDPPIKPEIVRGLKTTDDVFEHFKPQVELDYEDADGVTTQETLEFRNLGDFGVKGITSKSQFLKNLTTEKEQYQKIIKQLKTNKIMRAALTDPEAKEALMGALNNLINELNNAD